jgi:hypothetical protein
MTKQQRIVEIVLRDGELQPRTLNRLATLNLVQPDIDLSFRTSRASFLPPPLGSLSGSDRERFEFAYEVV